MQAVAQKDFRQDVNGLRAWAVVLVALFHFNVAGFGAGFMGVDIFFVISGFFMASIIVSGLEASDSSEPFSVWRFYVARGVRIAPALMFFCIVLLTLGWFYLPQMEYAQLVKHAIAALFQVSNIVLWKEVGYFDPQSLHNFLLHTWSVSLEWQFYLILPLALLVAWKIRPSRSFLFAVLALGWIASFLLSVYFSITKPSTAFFMLPTRAWELISGCLVFFIAHYLSARRLKMGPAIEVCGWLAIILALVLFDRDTQWPGWQALFPVVGTALIILAARKESIVTRGFIAQWIGKRSYSLYLWHWPVVVVLIYLDKMNDPLAVAAGVLLSLILGAVSYYLVETPGRKELRQLGPRVACVSLVVLTLAICIPTSVIFVRHGMAGRLSFDNERAFMALKDRAQQTVACDDDCEEDTNPPK